MERITVDGRAVELSSQARSDVLTILKQYLQSSESAQATVDLETQLSTAARRHREHPRLYGRALREVLSQAQPEAAFESLFKTGIMLNVLLDRLAFASQKPTDPALAGWPKDKYLPDGFSFLSYDNDIDRSPTDQKGEKIRIDKAALLKGLPQQELLALARSVRTIINTLPVDSEGKRQVTNLDTIRQLYQLVSDFLKRDVFENSALSQRPVSPLESGSILLNEYVHSPMEAVCRHKELLAQVLLQTLGLPGEILECHTYIDDNMRGNHLATKLTANGESYIVDFTNPTFDDKVFFEPINERVDTDHDVNKVLWKGTRRVGRGGKEVYYLSKQTAKPVYHRVLHGWEK